MPTKSRFKSVEYVILKIILDDSDNIIFYNDPNFKDKGIYTYDNIDKKYIHQIE